MFLLDVLFGYIVKFIFYCVFYFFIVDLYFYFLDFFIYVILLYVVLIRYKEDFVLIWWMWILRRIIELEWREEWIVVNVLVLGFVFKCCLYDEDWLDYDDRLGNVIVRVLYVSEDWEGFGFEGKIFEVKKCFGSCRVYFVYGIRLVFCCNVLLILRM